MQEIILSFLYLLVLINVALTVWRALVFQYPKRHTPGKGSDRKWLATRTFHHPAFLSLCFMWAYLAVGVAIGLGLRTGGADSTSPRAMLGLGVFLVLSVIGVAYSRRRFGGRTE